jgi:hypothetical protein
MMMPAMGREYPPDYTGLSNAKRRKRKSIVVLKIFSRKEAQKNVKMKSYDGWIRKVRLSGG